MATVFFTKRVGEVMLAAVDSTYVERPTWAKETPDEGLHWNRRQERWEMDAVWHACKALGVNVARAKALIDVVAADVLADYGVDRDDRSDKRIDTYPRGGRLTLPCEIALEIAARLMNGEVRRG